MMSFAENSKRKTQAPTSGSDPSRSPRASGSRLTRLDEIRGLTLISMMLYHFLWDLVYIAGISIPWYHGREAHIWQQSICWTFIFLSGFCWSLGTHQLKRGLTVFFSGGLVTAATLLFLPQDRVIFGVLTLLGSSTLLLIPLHRVLVRIPNRACLAAGLLLSALLFRLSFGVNSGSVLLPDKLYANYFTAYLGFPAEGFFSTDYFPLIPWFFLFLTGYFAYRLLDRGDRLQSVSPKFLRKFLTTRTIPFADFLGRHSLPIYLLHQPVLYGVTLLIMRFTQ